MGWLWLGLGERAVERVALGGDEAGFADEAVEVGDVEFLVGAQD